MAQNSEEIAKELTLAVLPRLSTPMQPKENRTDADRADVEATADMVATLYRTILRAVNQGPKQ